MTGIYKDVSSTQNRAFISLLHLRSVIEISQNYIYSTGNWHRNKGLSYFNTFYQILSSQADCFLKIYYTHHTYYGHNCCDEFNTTLKAIRLNHKLSLALGAAT